MYLLFAGDSYYPEGGWFDFRGTFPSREAAAAAAEEYDWYHVVGVDWKITHNKG